MSEGLACQMPRKLPYIAVSLPAARSESCAAALSAPHQVAADEASAGCSPAGRKAGSHNGALPDAVYCTCLPLVDASGQDRADSHAMHKVQNYTALFA